MTESVITRMLNKLFGKADARVLMVGLDACGRTTALYRLKLGETVTTIPTIGFNVESVVYRTTSFTFWDVGGCDKIRPLWRHYFQGTHAVFFVIDSNDRERLDEAVRELSILMQAQEIANAVIMVLANKQDLPNAMSVTEIMNAVKSKVKITSRVLFQATCATTGDGLYEALDATLEAMKQQKHSTPTAIATPATPTPTTTAVPVNQEPPKSNKVADEVETVLQEWLEREDTDSDDEFLAKLENCTLDSWDHYTHLRIAWLLLGRHGRREGMSKIFSMLRHFIENSPRTKRSRGTTFHETMTYFWAHMVHYAMTATANPDNSFKTFLLLNPQLANGGMFLHFYSKKLMLNTAESRTQVVLPDKRPLPSILSDVSRATTTPQGVVMQGRGQAIDTDEAFMESVQNLTYKSWGHRQIVRCIWIVLHTHGRQKGVSMIMELLEKVCGGPEHFNVTLTYFWIQMVTLANAKLSKEKAGSEPRTFEQFENTKVGKDLVSNEVLYRKHYSDQLIFSASAAKEMTLPDKAPLPNVL